MSSSSMWGGFRPSTAFRLSRWKFMIFAWFFFFETQNFQKFYIKPPKFLILTCFKQQKRKLHCILTLITDLGLKWQAIKWAWGGIRPTSAWLGLTNPSISFFVFQMCISTLEFLISGGPQISVDPGKNWLKQ